MLGQSTLVAVVALVTTIIGTLVGAFGYAHLVKKDTYTAGAAEGTLRADNDYIKRRIDDVLLEQKDTNRNIKDLGERVTRVEESAKSAHHRIDEIVEGKKG